MDETMQKLQHIESIDALTLLRPGVAQKALFASRILKQLLPTRIKLTAKTVDEDPASCKHWISKKRAKKRDLISQNINNQKREVQRLVQS